MNLEIKNRADATNDLVEAMNAQDKNEVVTSLQAYGDALILELKERMQQELDGRALNAQGIPNLTAKEKEFAEGVKAMAKAKLTGVKMALTDTDVVMPETIINRVFEDITVEHPLLNYIDFQNTTYSTKWMMSKLAVQKAQWGAVDAEVTKELAASFLEMDMTLLSLTAFIPVSWALLDLGPNWIITYVVTMLKEAIANGLEDGIINGKGNGEEPVGLIRDLEGKEGVGNLAAQDFTALTKNTKKITKLDPKTVGEILDYLSETPNGNRRVVNQIVLAVNPADYYTKVYPAITVQGTNGSYLQHVLPYNTVVVQSSFVEKGKAVALLPQGYCMLLGQSGIAGKIQFSDDYKFLERKRFYMTSLYANGQPKDNHVAMYLDISGLKPAAISVEVVTEAGE